MNLAERFRRLARQAKAEGLEAHRMAPATEPMRTVFLEEYARYQPAHIHREGDMRTMPATLTQYSLRGFRRWLSHLPQDEPFCEDGCCPIATYMIRELRFPENIAKAWAPREEPVMTTRIDIHCIGREDWTHLTPRRVLELLSV